MAPKSKQDQKKVEEAKAEEPAEKKAKTDGEEAPAEETKPAGIPETEVDDKADKRPKLSDKVGFNTSDTTLNVVPCSGGLLTSLSEGGMQYLIAGARSNAGIKSGRYMFEVRILENLSYYGGGKPPHPKNLLRVGFSTAGSSLILGDGGESVGFDSEGFFLTLGATGSFEKKKWTTVHTRQGRLAKDNVVGVLLNLEAKTVSLFKDGERVSDPQPLPEALVGKTLFPHVAFRNVTVQVNLSATPLKALPFKATSVGAAAKEDVAVSKAAAPAGGKYEVLFPVGFPGEGCFDWVDMFHEKNPGYTEISDRMLIEWAQKSGVHVNRPHGQKGDSRDRPQVKSGVQSIDDFSARKVAFNACSVVPRNYVIMEVKRNLCAKDRKELLKQFPSCSYKRIAKVAMGEPPAALTSIVKDKILKLKQTKLDIAFKRKKADKERQKAAEKRKKEMAEKAAAAKAKKAAEGKEGEEKKEEEKKEEEAPKEEEKAEEAEEEPPKAELTEEESKLKFVKHDQPDITDAILDRFFTDFSIPEKGEGFDEIKFEWDSVSKVKEFLKGFIMEKKKTSRIENLVAGEWFKTQSAEWAKKLGEWKKKQAEAAKTKKWTEDEENAISVMDCDNIEDVGKETPLYLKFGPEDWILMVLRWESYALATAYKKDVNDPDRTNIPEQHFHFYFNKYFKKNFNKATYGKDSITEVLKLVKDTAAIEDGALTTVLDEELPSLDIFVKLTENARRERQRRIDAGDETAKLDIKIPGAPVKK